MFSRKISAKIRKTHRYLGLLLGLQFLMWTISGLYFSWTNIDDIHGDQFKRTTMQMPAFDSLISPSALDMKHPVHTIELRDLNQRPYYWINNHMLVDAKSGEMKMGVSEEEARYVADQYLIEGLKVTSVELITSVDKHHEYREKLLPAYVISFDHDEAIKAYVSQADGKFQTVRHRSWRWFDFLWMTHTMDYEGRDNFNTTVLRAFSLFGLITVMSGFTLWFTSSSRIRKRFSAKR
jgi:uncharacterized iron-regulated membrane protein